MGVDPTVSQRDYEPSDGTFWSTSEKSEQGTLNSVCCNYDVVRCSAERESCPGAKHDLPREQGEGPRQGRGVQAEEWAAQATVLHRNTGQYGYSKYNIIIQT